VEPPLNHFRVSVLTFAGVCVAETYGPRITATDPLAAALGASNRLVVALTAKNRRKPEP
jgi:hypothetical protein